MNQPDNVARIIAGLALVVAICSAVVAWLTFRRGSVRVKVTLERATATTYADGLLEWEILRTVARNLAHTPIQVTSLWYDVEGQAESLVEVRPSGERLPYVLQGRHEGTWSSLPASVARHALAASDGVDQVRVRTAVQLATGDLKRSDWLTVTRQDLR